MFSLCCRRRKADISSSAISNQINFIFQQAFIVYLQSIENIIFRFKDEFSGFTLNIKFETASFQTNKFLFNFGLSGWSLGWIMHLCQDWEVEPRRSQSIMNSRSLFRSFSKQAPAKLKVIICRPEAKITIYESSTFLFHMTNLVGIFIPSPVQTTCQAGRTAGWCWRREVTPARPAAALSRPCSHLNLKIS